MRHLPPQHVKLHRQEQSNALLKSAVLLLLILTLSYAIMFRSTFFRFQRMMITGEKTYHSRVFALVRASLPYTFSSLYKAEQTVRTRIPAIENITLQENIFTRALKISYTIRQPFLRWCLATETKSATCFVVDKNGVIFASFTNQTFIPTVFDSYFLDLETGKKIPSSTLVPLTNILEAFAKHDISAFSFTLKAPFSLTAKTTLVEEIRFSLEENTSEQLQALFFFLTDTKEDIANLFSIDLRIPHKIYYK